MTFARLTLIAAAVATLAACGKKEETPAAGTAAPAAAPAAEALPVIKIGHVALCIPVELDTDSSSNWTAMLISAGQ